MVLVRVHWEVEVEVVQQQLMFHLLMELVVVEAVLGYDYLHLMKPRLVNQSSWIDVVVVVVVPCLKRRIFS